MYCLVNILTKRLINNVFVSNNCLQIKCFHSFMFYKQIVDKNFEFNNKIQIKRNNHLINDFVDKRYFSKTNSENESKVLTNDSLNENSKELKKSLEIKFKKYCDKDSDVIYDVLEEQISNELKANPLQVLEEWKESDPELYLYQQKKKIIPNKTSLKRGVTGVFDLHELIDLLRKENLNDIAVIKVPKEMNYCQYLVLANAKSKRHINAFVEYFNKVYKMKKSNKDPFLNFGGDNCEDWKVVDMKHIVLHIFQKNTRDYYDIETLWTVGHEFDDKVQIPETDTVMDIMEKHIKFLQQIKPSN